MKITRADDAVHVTKPEGADVRYYLFDDYEVHYNEQAPHTTLQWHHHETIAETLYIIDGELIAQWRDGKIEYSEVIRSGDLAEAGSVPHTFVNNSDDIARFLVIKRMPTSENYRDVFKTDKVLD